MTSKVFTYDAPCVIRPFEDHAALRDLVLEKILKDAEDHDRKYDYYDQYDVPYMDIFTDYTSELEDLPYYDLIRDPLNRHMVKVIREDMGFHDVNDVSEIWYQIYYNQQMHGWHVHHNCNFTSVWYLEFPEGAPCTEFMDTRTKEVKVIEGLKEGDILTFPSYVVHRAPVNLGQARKTIISWHVDVIWDPPD